MVSRGVMVAFAALTATAALAQESTPVKGEYERIAACVYKALDPMAPGNFHYVDLRADDTIIITFETYGGGGTFRAMKATFSKAGDGFTAIEVEGQAPGYYPNKVRPLAEQCSATLPVRPAIKKIR